MPIAGAQHFREEVIYQGHEARPVNPVVQPGVSVGKELAAGLPALGNGGGTLPNICQGAIRAVRSSDSR